MSVKVIGADEIVSAFNEILENLNDGELVTTALASSMSDYVHVQSGYLKSTIYYSDWEAGATAPYAGFEADRGGSHAFDEKAIQSFDFERYADKIVEAF